MRRGEIWTAAAGGYASKPRPVVILQDDAFANTGSITVALFTSDPTDAPLIRIEVEPTVDNGLDAVSRVQVDKVVTVRRASLGKRIGVLEREKMVALERSLVVFLGLAR